MSLPINQVLIGNCMDVMAGWPDNSIDCIVTDPPYGINFMGKEWDKALPPKEAFIQMFRVLKPGALAFIMSSPRQDVLWRMLALLEGVGFELRQSAIFWIYRTGFPKSYDVSKGIDRKHYKLKVGLSDFQDYLNEKRKEKALTLREINKILGAPENSGLSAHKFSDKSQPQFLTREQLNILKPILGIDEEYVEIYDELEREIIGKGKSGIGSGQSYAFFQQTGLKPSEYDETLPASDLAKKWSGWKSQTSLKPAVEMILMVNKPRSEPTIVDNVLRWGTGALNVDACRIPYKQGDVHPQGPDRFVGHKGKGRQTYNASNYEESLVGKPIDQSKGRFPANLIISNGALDTGEKTKSIKINGSKLPPTGSKGIYGKYQVLPTERGYDDEGSPFRFFDLDAWAEHNGFLDVSKPSKAERDFGLTTQPLRVPKSKFNLNDGSKDMRFDGVTPTKRRNIHPTCKPVKLMAYLIELGCPPKGIVLDPFLGSGTTCISAKRLRRNWIGIEINPVYAEIAEARINIRGPLDQFMEAENA